MIEELSRLPGIGSKSAQRLAFYILHMPKEDVRRLSDTLVDAREHVRYCKECYTLTDQEVCPICASIHRDHQTVCVVENVQDVMSIENTGQYNGVYHVLGGIISPIDGIGPKDLEIDSLIARIAPEHIKEVILALPTTLEGDTTNFYIYRRLTALEQPELPVVSQIARGVAVGNELEYTDEITLGRSILNRVEFKG